MGAVERLWISASATLDFECGEERTRRRMHLHRSSALGYASAASAAHSWYTAGCAVRAPLKRRLNDGKRLGLKRVGGCIRASAILWAVPRPRRSKRTRARGAVRKAGMKSGPKKIQEKKSLSNRYNINKRIDTHDCHWRGGSARAAHSHSCRGGTGRGRRRRWWWEEVVVVRGWQATTGVIVTATRQCRGGATLEHAA